MDSQTLIDGAQIIDAMNNVAICADLGQWDKLLTQVFADQVTVDYSSLFGGDEQTMSAIDLVNAWRQLLPGFESTQHLLSNYQVTISGDKATALAYVRANHYLPNKTGGDTWVLGGYYNYELIRAQQNWRVSKMKLTVQYSEGNQNLLTIAREYANANNLAAAK